MLQLQTLLQEEKCKYEQIKANYGKLVNQVHAVEKTLQVVNGQLQQNSDEWQLELVKLLESVSNV